MQVAKLLSIGIIGILIIGTVTATFPRNNALEERRNFKVGPTQHFWITCDSHSMDFDCKKYYWAFTPKFEDLEIGDIAAYRIISKERPQWDVPKKINYIVHRIINITEACITFKGDNNLNIDPFCIEPKRVRYVLLWEEEEPWLISVWDSKGPKLQTNPDNNNTKRKENVPIVIPQVKKDIHPFSHFLKHHIHF